MSGVDLEAVASHADQALREPVAELVQDAMAQGADPAEAVSAVLSGLFGTATSLAWAFRDPGQSPDAIADTMRRVLLHFLRHCEVSDARGGSA